ncbi:MAG: ATP-grasp domain-containing protein [Proteobacteria bacterium]|nr:ATP-grasp domain-containing protein [Pseudomonadota bacterium]
MFNKILIANRAEIAERILRTCTQMGITTAVVYTHHDADAPFVTLADEAVPLVGGATYLDVESIVAAAVAVGADAVHPGYGFLSENPDFARSVTDAGITFIGPSPEVIETMGSKIASRDVMDNAGVPVLAIAEIGVVQNPLAAGDELGYPLLVKASSGGGGKGMRIVEEPAALIAAIQSAEREAASAFGDGRVYLERYVGQGRHIEVQILGDGHGNVVHVYERECSIQRRFQKVIEESPAPNLDDGVRSALLDAAVIAGRAVAYRGAGTVEFIVGDEGSIAFLEMNARLQVEHPVTEMITGMDLVRSQIEIAWGSELPSQEEIPPRSGHAIEARLYAESPLRGFEPSTGELDRFTTPEWVRTDAGVRCGSVIHHHYDPLLAKVIAHGPTRREARSKLARGLAASHIHGIDTNRDLLVAVLDDPAFVEGSTDTGYLERNLERLVAASMSDEGTTGLNAGVAALAKQASNRRRTGVLATVPSGWRNVRSQSERITLRLDETVIEVAYVMSPLPVVTIDDVPLDISHVYTAVPDRVDLVAGGVRTTFSVHISGDVIYVDSPRGSSRFDHEPRFASDERSIVHGALVARTPGVVVSVAVAVGDTVAAGETIIVIEAMKMEQTVVASVNGRVEVIHHRVGDQVQAGAVLAEIVEVEGNDA